MLRTLFSSLLAATLLSAVPALASDDLEVTTDIYRQVTKTDAQGDTYVERAKLDQASPGQKIIYQINVHNAVDAPRNDVTLHFPVSKDIKIDVTSFTSELPMTVTFSTRDAPKDFAPFADLKVTPADGNTRPAGADDLAFAEINLSKIPADKAFFIEYSAVVR